MVHTQTALLLLVVVRNIYSTTVMLSPSILHAKYWHTLTQQTSVAPISCVLRCEADTCPGVAFDREKNLCHFGFPQTTPISYEEDTYLEIWKVKPLDEYVPPPTGILKYLPRNDCALYSGWIKESNGKRYQINSSPLTKAEHETLCRDQGALLSMVKTKLDEDIISSLIGESETWIGITNVHNASCWNASCDGHLVWSDGTMFKYDSDIYSKVISIGAGHACSRIQGSQYNDSNCLALFAGVCEVTCD
ncbi:uncharacterized protein LOC131888838 [Tigriopus californicus]|uniref:uncharacterized protein LOC131888838 n=1 Tax=Tigriopus californicus TaxID=6832 RepID=UPI0027DA9295|nr:uncharacterized protein LOC131888838 [Tigriopus californicus]